MISRIKLAFEAIFKKSTTLQDVNPDPELGDSIQLTPMQEPIRIVDAPSGTTTPMGTSSLKKVQLVSPSFYTSTAL